MNHGGTYKQFHANTENLSRGSSYRVPMSIDDKIRYGMIAVTGASVVLATLGVHVGPITTNQVGTWGGS
jgi:hypothetical protein